MKRALILLIFCILISCNDSKIDCSTVLCAAREDFIALRFLDRQTEDNLLMNGTVDDAMIQVTTQGNTVDFYIRESTYSGKKLVFEVSPEFGEKSFVVTFNDEEPLLINLNTSLRPNDGCCGPFTDVDNIEVLNYPSSFTNYGTLPLDIDIYVE